MTDILSYRFGSLNMIPDVTPNGVFYLPPTGWLTSFYNPPQFTSYQNLASFMKKIKEKILLTDEEVAGYLRTQFNLHAFPLQKVLYYSYSDYLEENVNRLFWCIK